MKSQPPAQEAVVMRLVGGPLDGQHGAFAPGDTELRYVVPDDDLERLLEASVAVKQGKLTALPTKTAVYRRQRLGDDKVTPLERYVMQFEGWE